MAYHSPGLFTYASVQASLLCHTGARVLKGSGGGARHVLDRQVFHRNQPEAAHQICRDPMALVAVPDTLSVLLIRKHRTAFAPAMAALLARRQPSLRPSQLCIGLAPAAHVLSIGQRQPIAHSHIHADSGFAFGQCCKLDLVCQVDKEPASPQRDGKRLRDVFWQIQSLTKSYLGQTLDADGAIAAPRLDHRRSDIGKLDGMPAPRGLEARIARCLACLHPAIKGLTRSICTAQNSSTNLDGHAAPELVLSAYRREFTILAVERHTHACSIRPAPLFERRIIEPGALAHDLGKALVPGPARVGTVLICLVDLDHAYILTEQRFLPVSLAI